MAKTTAPILSLGASGTIAKTMVYSTWRGIPYVRRHLIPSNPNTTAQQATRNVFTTMSAMWKVAPALLSTPWDTFATGRAFLGRNAFIGQNVKAMRAEVDANNFIGSPGARGGLPPDSIIATPGVGTISIAFTNPAVPTGWTLIAAVGIAFPDQDPALAFVGPTTAGEDTAAPQDTVLLSSLDTVLHQVRAWLQWTKPDGATAYSASINATATPT